MRPLLSDAVILIVSDMITGTKIFHLNSSHCNTKFVLLYIWFHLHPVSTLGCRRHASLFSFLPKSEAPSLLSRCANVTLGRRVHAQYTCIPTRLWWESWLLFSKCRLYLPEGCRLASKSSSRRALKNTLVYNGFQCYNATYNTMLEHCFKLNVCASLLLIWFLRFISLTAAHVRGLYTVGEQQTQYHAGLRSTREHHMYTKTRATETPYSIA